MCTYYASQPYQPDSSLTFDVLYRPPRTVQVFLQNRRQRDTKNRVAVNDAESAKKEAKESTSAEFNFSVPKSAEMEMSSQKELSAVTNMLKSKLSRSSLSSTTRANASEQKPQSGMRPYGTSIMTLDNIAEKMESVRPCHEWKENIPSSDPFSSPITEPITLDEHKSPLKHIQFTPPPTALWTRMISSPPTPLSPTNRRDGWRRITRVQSVAKFHNLELACALSRGGNRQSEDKVVRRLEPDPLPLPRARTLSFQKRMREDVESNIPRKRASILDFHQATDTATHACPKPKARYTEQQSIAVRRGGCETDSSTGTTTGDELGTPEDSIAPSSPSIEPFMSHVTRLMEESQDIPEQGLTGDGKTVNALSEREADAAMVLASLFGQA
jgi:hypothetical protein